MKNQKKAVNAAAKVVYPVIVFLTLLSLVTILFINGNNAIRGEGFPVPVPFATLFNFALFEGHQAYMLGQILNNIVSYIFMFTALLLFILSLALINHNMSLKIKSAVVAILLLVPATLGVTHGFIDFVGHGFVVLFQTRQLTLLIVMILIYVLDFVYYAAAIAYLAYSIKLAVKVNKGELSLEEEEKATGEAADDEQEKEEEEAEKRAALLKEIRQIVREELDRLDRVAIVKEYESAQPAPQPQPEPEPEPEPEEPEEEPEEEQEEGGMKRVVAPRVPFAEKIIKADKEIQEKYNELKNDFLAYGASSRLSIAGDTFRLHRKPYVKITLVGKTLKVYFALDPKDFIDSPIPVVDASDKNAYEEVPALLKVKSNLSVKRAKDLAAMAFAKDGVEKEQEAGNHNYVKDIRAELRAQKK